MVKPSGISVISIRSRINPAPYSTKIVTREGKLKLEVERAEQPLKLEARGIGNNLFGAFIGRLEIASDSHGRFPPGF